MRLFEAYDSSEGERRPHENRTYLARGEYYDAVLAASPAQAAPETPVECNQVVTGTVKLANDLVCLETDGLIVGSDNTVIDLNGKRIVCIGAGYEGSCQGIVPPGGVSDPEFENGVDIDGKRNVHVFTSVPGATITGFDNGVNINRSSNVKVEHLVITGPPQSSDPANPRPVSHGVLIRGANCGGGSLHNRDRPGLRQRHLEQQSGNRNQRGLRRHRSQPPPRQRRWQLAALRLPGGTSLQRALDQRRLSQRRARQRSRAQRR